MSSLKYIFGNCKDEAWERLCSEICGEFIAGTFSQNDKVVAQVEKWMVVLDTLTVGVPGGATATYTRVRTAYENTDGFRFRIRSKRVPGKLWKKPLGIQGVEISCSELTQRFTITSNDESKVRELLSNPQIRHLVQRQPSMDLEVRHDRDGLGPILPDGVDQLYFYESGVITDVKRLKSLYELFEEILNQLCRMGSASEDSPDIAL